MRDWIQALRPKTLLIALTSLMIPTALVHRISRVHWDLFFWMLLTALLLQICANLANDYFDGISGQDRPEMRKGPARAVASKLISQKKMAVALITTALLSAASALPLILQGGLTVALIFSLTLITVIMYSASRHSLSRLGLGDLAALLFCGPLPFLATLLLQRVAVNPLWILLSLTPGLLAAAVLNINNIRDIEEDKSAGRKTLPIRFGKSIAKVLYRQTLRVALILPALFGLISSAKFLLLPSLLLIFPAKRLSDSIEKEEQLNAALGETALLSFAFSLLFSMALLYTEHD